MDQDLPADLALELAAAHDHGEGDDGGEMQDDREGDEEADGTPHATEVALVAGALVFGRERAAWRVVEVRAAAVKTDVLGVGFAFGRVYRVGDPVREIYGGNRQCSR